MTVALLPELAERLDEVEIDGTHRRARIGDRTLTAETLRELRTMLSGALYDTWHVGWPQSTGPQRKPTRDHAFEEVLRAAVPHDNSVMVARVDPEQVGTSSVVVPLNGIRVRVPADRIVMAGDDGGTARVRMPAVLPAVSPGFLMVSGSSGVGPSVGSLLRIYLHLATPEAAPVVWGSVLTRLEERGVAYRAKITSAPKLFPRRDAMVVYLGANSWNAADDVRGAAVATGGLDGTVSVYVTQLDAGVGCAWEPDDPRPSMRGMSFGEHRSQAIAAGLVAASADGPEGRHAAVADALLAAGIDPRRPFRNTTSPELSGN